jgi:prepilin-type N-terminal cleavage/methylation domain-containing protein
MPIRTRAFTLVELLVVITIIVVLLAMMAPALERAIYQAELAVCAAQQRGVATGAITYASQFARHYPYREAVHDPNISIVEHRQLTTPANKGQTTNADGYDERPLLRTLIDVDALQCPLAGDLDLEISDASDTYVYPTINRFFGWRYVGSKGMLRLGDPWNWGNTASRIMISDYWASVSLFGVWVPESAHPDVNSGKLRLIKMQDEVPHPLILANLADPDAKHTLAMWNTDDDGAERVVRVDVNYLYDDMSVERINQFHWDPALDDRVRRVGAYVEGGAS